MPKRSVYDRHLRLMVTTKMRDRLDALDREHPETSISEIVREAIEIGLPRAERRLRLRKPAGSPQ